ncbi:MAG TPA: SIMPL domain-containing protein, partial [Flavisolibacter sp.]|nr:SIMPL domain-containing protein [Flavisolibacter sp.]
MKFLSMLFLLFLSLLSNAQMERNPFPKTITVTGSAEIELIPDQIFVIVTLKEYDKKGSGKINLEIIKTNFLQSVKATGLPDSAVSIDSYTGYNGNPWLRKKNKKEELYASISYQVKLKSSQQMDNLVDRLDDNATQNFYISSTSHSKLDEYRKILKVQAVKAAKDKAIYLAAAINENVGAAVTINEPNEYYMGYSNNVNVMMRGNVNSESAPVDQAA